MKRDPNRSALPDLPVSFAVTREALHSVACYVIAPARKARTGRIGLVPAGRGFGTPPFDDGSAISVDGDRLRRADGDRTAFTTLRDAAAFVGVELVADPGVGHDLPPFRPDAPLTVDAAASYALGDWYAFGAAVLRDVEARYGTRHRVAAAQLWPEHFDLAIAIEDDDGRRTNVGCSPGDAHVEVPYVYVGPVDHPLAGDPFWNAPFGAVLRHDELGADPPARVASFLDAAFTRLGLLPRE
jgi:hypothetical protein